MCGLFCLWWNSMWNGFEGSWLLKDLVFIPQVLIFDWSRYSTGMCIPSWSKLSHSRDLLMLTEYLSDTIIDSALFVLFWLILKDFSWFWEVLILEMFMEYFQWLVIPYWLVTCFADWGFQLILYSKYFIWNL